MPIVGDRALTSKPDGLTFIQPDGPNTQVYPLFCRTLGDISASLGGIELVLGTGANGEYVTKGYTKSAFEPLDFSFENLLTKKADWLEDLKDRDCGFAVYVKQQECGLLTDHNNFERLILLSDSLITNYTYQGMVTRDEDTVSMYNVDLQAAPPAVTSFAVTVNRMTFANVDKANDIAMNVDDECDSNCGVTYKKGDRGVIVTDSASGAKPKPYFTTNGGVTWTVAAALPGANDDDLSAVIRVHINNTVRTITSKTGVTTTQGQIFYSDNDGVSWTTVSVGGATAGHGATYGKGLFAFPYDPYFIWMATFAGYIYKSVDGGATWTAKDSGVVTTGNYKCIHFADKQYGVAGAVGDIIAITNNGGDSWSAATAVGTGGDIISCARLDKNRIWVGTDDGDLFYSLDGGTTWTQRTSFANTDVGQVRSMHWLDKWNGVFVSNTAGPVGSFFRTHDGGYTWKQYTNNVTNAGLNSVWMTSANLMYAVGQPTGGTAVVYKANNSIQTGV
jgi:photosystem II stability/assembly factor-like uncharacterized protein